MPELEVELVPTGPDQQTYEELKTALLAEPVLKSRLERTRHRVLSFELFDPDPKAGIDLSPSSVRASIFDYTNNQTLVARATIARLAAVEVDAVAEPPLPNADELEEAKQILAADAQLGGRIARGDLIPYPAMPPLVAPRDASADRTLSIGLLPAQDRSGHEIVGVNMVRREVVRFPSNAPPGAQAHNPICGLPGVYQPTTDRGTPGQMLITATHGATVLWRMLAIRPATSAGYMGSGIELRDVYFRGRRVLRQAHLPILNVRYDGDVCGPYRDWQWQEGNFAAKGTDVAPGFRWCAEPAKTIIDSGADHGNFRGVAIFTEGPELVLVSELEAGWYRYISEWRFHEDGTIRPRLGFSAVKNSCVCTTHQHHAYWRFDFDIGLGTGDRVVEFNEPLPGAGTWQPQVFETKRSRDPSQNRQWRVEDAVAGHGYAIVPGDHDGSADDYGRGDLWVLAYHPNEIDDGWPAPSWAATEADLDRYVNGEVVDGGDVVVWYGAHFVHEGTHEKGFGHRVGPDLTPHRW